MIAAVLLAGCIVAPPGGAPPPVTSSSSVYDVDGKREGAVKESSPGRFDVYDVNGQRLGDRYSRRIGEIRPDARPAPRPGGRR